jgi:hypothetical protein
MWRKTKDWFKRVSRAAYAAILGGAKKVWRNIRLVILWIEWRITQSVEKVKRSISLGKDFILRLLIVGFTLLITFIAVRYFDLGRISPLDFGEFLVAAGLTIGEQSQYFLRSRFF